MKKLVLVVVISLALPAAALGKGPSAAEIRGPGLKTISLSGDGEDGGASTFGRFTEAAGFFPAMFGQQPDPMLRSRPKSDLGPRFTITWVVPGRVGTVASPRTSIPTRSPTPSPTCGPVSASGAPSARTAAGTSPAER